VVTATDERSSFEISVEPPLVGSTEFSHTTVTTLWEKVRSAGISPEWCGPLDDTPELRAEFLAGARLMGFELVDLDDLEAVEALRSSDPQLEPIQPQQLLVADALNAGTDVAAIEMPRRASKTTTILCWCLGRCVSRPRYKVTYSAQDGMSGVANLDEWARDGLDRINPPTDDGLPPWLRNAPKRKPKAQQRAEALFGADVVPFDEPAAAEKSGRCFIVYRSVTKAGVYFDNGSAFYVVRPDAKAFRGKAADISWVDESQEIEPTEGAALLAGILPLQDTRPGSMTIVSGTAGELRAGPLWEFLARLRAGDPTMGGLDFAAPEDTPWSVVEDEDAAIALLKRVHPGVGTLTTEEKMRKRWRTIPKPEWAREYLSLWPETFGERAVPAEWWANTARAKRPERPRRVAFGVAIKPGGSVAAIVAAWRDGKGRAYLEVVEHRPGTAWLPKRMQELSRSYPGSTIAYDDIGEGRATAGEALRLRPKPRIRVQTYSDTAAGCVQFLRDLERGTLVHFTGQIGLDSAVEQAAKRSMRNDDKVWLFTPMERGGDITCLDAAVRALRNWDHHYDGKSSTDMGIVAA
jgi:hypothetical protein